MAINRYKLIRFAEYASVSASVLGAIAAITTRQIAYAVAPLSVSVALNLISRRQQVQHIERHLTQAIITQIDQRLDRVSQQNKLLQQNLNALAQATEQQSADVALTYATTEALQALDSDINQRIQILSNEIQAIRELTEQQGQNMSDFASLSRLEDLAANLRNLQISLDTGAAQTEENLERELQSLAQTQQQLLNEQQAALNRSITGLEGDILQLRGDLAYLRQEIENLIIRFRERLLQPETTIPSVPSVLPEVPVSSGEEPAADFSQIIPQLPTGEGYDLEINLGIDFGTGFTKVCFRDIGRELSEIVTFADAEATQNGLSLDQTLIPTKIAILQDGTLLTGLTVAEWKEADFSIRKSIDFIKMRLAHLDLPSESAWRLEQTPELEDPTTVENLCAYYLSKVIRRAQEWIQTNRSDLFVNQTAGWSVNIGVPVKYCDSPARERFKRVLSLAWVLNYTPLESARLTIPMLNQLIAHLQYWMANNSIDELGCITTTEEIAAAVWSFLSSRQAQEGFYTCFDIGDGTLDGAAFRFWRGDDGEHIDFYDHVDFYKAEVEPLGVIAFTQQAAAELHSSVELIRQALVNTSDYDLQDKLQQSQVRREVQKLIATVVMKGNKKHLDSHPGFVVADDIGHNLRVFIGGGGGNTSFFQNTIRSTHSDFQQDRAGIPPYQIKQIPAPETLSINGLEPKEFNRFSVAYGLCIPKWQGPKILLPSQIEDGELPIYPDTPRTRYEDTRDLT
ncbi:MAG: hypothetical protein AAF703_23860 [Cyanobacteria bacterium P01_D01_bin.105]